MPSAAEEVAAATTTTAAATNERQRPKPSNDDQRRRQYCSDSENDRRDTDEHGARRSQVSAGAGGREAAPPEDAAAQVRTQPARRVSRAVDMAHLRQTAAVAATATAATAADRPDAGGQSRAAMCGGGRRVSDRADYAGGGSPDTSDECTQNGNAGSGDDGEASRQVDLSSLSVAATSSKDRRGDDCQDKDYGRRGTREPARPGRGEKKVTQGAVGGGTSKDETCRPIWPPDSVSRVSQRRRQSSGQVRRASVEPIGRPEAIGQQKAACPLAAARQQQRSGAAPLQVQVQVQVQAQVLQTATNTALAVGPTSARRHHNKGVKRSNESVECEDADDDSSAAVNVSPLAGGRSFARATQTITTITGSTITAGASRADSASRSSSPSAADNNRCPKNSSCSSPRRHNRRRVQPPEDDSGDQSPMTQSQKLTANNNTGVQQQSGIIVAESFASNSMDNNDNNTDSNNVRQHTLEERHQQQHMDENNIGQPQVDAAAYNSSEALTDEARQDTDTEDTDDQSPGDCSNELDYESVLTKVLNEKKLALTRSPELIRFLSGRNNSNSNNSTGWPH